MIDYQLIGNRLKQARKAANLTQEALAEKVFLSTVYLSRIENGKVFPTLETLSSLCDVLGVSLGWLFSGIEIERSDYGGNQQVVELFQACKGKVKPIALNILRELSEL